MRVRFLIIPILFVSSLALGGEDWQPQPIGPFSGLNNRDNSFAIPSQNAQDLLNVNLTPAGKSVFKRKGFGLAFALPITTSPVHGIYTFFDSNGNTVDLYANDVYLSGSVNGASPTTIFSNGTNGATYQCTDTLGFAYCANTARTALTKTNGVTSSQISNVSSTGTMVATCVTRLAMAGFSDRPSGIDLSADSDFTTWGTGSLGTSAVQLTVSAPGARITHITYAFGRLMWFKNSSFGYVLIGNQPAQTDWVIKTVAYDVGTNDNTSVYREGILYFRGQDGHVYAFDGSTYQRSTREISGTIGVTQGRSSNSWLQTTQADFASGAQSTPGFLDTATVSGLVFLATAAPVGPFLDSTASDFGSASSVVNLDTTTISGSVTLSLGVESISVQNTATYNTPLFPNDSTIIAQSFIATSSGILTTVGLGIDNNSGSQGTLTVSLMSDNSNTPGSTLTSKVFTTTNGQNGFFNVNFTSYPILASTRYWIRLQETGGRTTSLETDSAGVFSGGKLYRDGNSVFDTYDSLFKIYIKQYKTTGNYTSRVFDVGFTTTSWLWSWSTLAANGTIPNGTTLTYETQTSTSATGTFTSLVSVSSGSIPTSTVQRFIRYVSSFTATDVSTSPVLNDIQISLSLRRRPSGTYYSAVKNAGSLTSWDSFDASLLNNEGTQTFYIRSATMAFTVLSATPSWTTIPNGSLPTVSTGTYFQIRDDFTIQVSTQNPGLLDFTQNWFEGAASDKAYGTYFDDKIWWEVASGAGATTNNKTLVYDMLNQTWTLYDLATNGFLVRNNRLYFGSASGGYIYKFGDVDNDNGSAINAYWKSKDFYGGSPFGTQELANISFANKTVANSSMTVTYTINGTTSTSYTFPTGSTTNNFIGKNKNLPAGLTAGTYNVQFGNNAVDQPFEVFGVQVGIRPKSWIPN